MSIHTAKLFGIMLIAVGFSCGAEQSLPSGEPKLLVENVSTVQHIGRPMVVRLIIDNTTDEVIRLQKINPYRDFNLELLDPDEMPVPLTSFGKEMRETSFQIDRNIAVVLRPKERTTEEIDLSRMFQITKSGTYKLSLQRNVYKCQGHSVDVCPTPLILRLEIQIVVE